MTLCHPHHPLDCHVLFERPQRSVLINLILGGSFSCLRSKFVDILDRAASYVKGTLFNKISFLQQNKVQVSLVIRDRYIPSFWTAILNLLMKRQFLTGFLLFKTMFFANAYKRIGRYNVHL